MEDQPELNFEEVEHTFIGRAKFLESLLEAWLRHRVFAVFGQKSVGKSRTVNEFLKRLQDNEDESNSKVIYVDLQRVTDIQTLRFKILVSMKYIDDVLEEDDDWVKQMCEKINKDSIGSYVLSFDNAEDCLNSQVRQDYITTCKTIINMCDKVRIIFSSTTKVTAGFPLFIWQELPPMDTADGCQLIKCVAPDVNFEGTLEKIVQLCCGLPLALNIVASLLNQEGSIVTPKDMVEILSQCRVRALSDESYVQDERIGFVYCNFIRQLTDEFQQRLAILGYIPGSFKADQASYLLADSTPSETHRQTLSPLLKRHMIKHEPRTMRYDIHAILQDCLAVYFQIENLPEIRKRYCRTFTAVMREVSLKMDTEEYIEAYAVFSQEQVNLKTLLTDVLQSEEESFPFYMEMASSCTTLIINYFSNETVVFFTKLFDLAQVYGKERDRALAMTMYGRAMINIMGDHEEAKRMLTMAVNIIEELEPASESLASILRSLGWTLLKQGHINDAIQQFERGVDVIQKAGCGDSLILCSLLNCLGLANKQAGNIATAERYMSGSLKLFKKKLKGDHPHFGSLYNNFGLIMAAKYDHAKAQEYFELGLEIKKKNNSHLQAVIASQCNVARCYINLDRITEAQSILTEALESLEFATKIYVYEKALVLDTLGMMYFKKGSYEEAIPRFLQAVSLKRNLNKGSNSHIGSLVKLGRAYKAASQETEALKSFQKAVFYENKVYLSTIKDSTMVECFKEMIEIFTNRGDVQKVKETYSNAYANLTKLISWYETNNLSGPVEQYRQQLAELKQSENANCLLQNK